MKTKLTPRQYLRQAYRLNELINSHLEELRLLRETIDGLSAVAYGEDKVRTSTTSSSVERTVEKIAAMQEKINGEIDRFVDLKAEIHDAIAQLGDPSEQLVLRLRYIQLKSWEEIQAVIGADTRKIFRVHRSALEHFRVPDSRFGYARKNFFRECQ